MAKELIVIPRKFDQPIVGDKMQMQGSHVRPATDARVDVGNSTYYEAADGVQYVELHAKSALWFRISQTGDNAAVGQDEFLAAGDVVERTIKPSERIKCIADA